MKSYIQQNEGAEKIDVTGALQFNQVYYLDGNEFDVLFEFEEGVAPEWFGDSVLDMTLILSHRSSEYVVSKPQIEGMVGFSGYETYKIAMRKVKPTCIQVHDYTQNIKELEFLLSQIGKEIKLHEGARESLELAIMLMRKK